MPEIELIARAFVCRDGKVLLNRRKGAKLSFLPGGHVEQGEPAREALRREIKEELGVDAHVGAFLSAAEHAFTRKGKPTHEVNLVFAVEVPGLSAGNDPQSLEDGFEFSWCPVMDLKKKRLEPSVICELAVQWTKAPPSSSVWASTIEPEGW